MDGDQTKDHIGKVTYFARAKWFVYRTRHARRKLDMLARQKTARERNNARSASSIMARRHLGHELTDARMDLRQRGAAMQAMPSSNATCDSRRGRCRNLLFCTAIVLGTPVYGAEPARDSPHAVYQPRAQMHLLASYWKAKHRSVAPTDTFSLSSHIVVPDQDAPAGGTATFGWFDSGEVKLLQYVEYLPSIQFAQTHRTLRPTKLPIEIGDLPRYAMVCAWPVENGKPSGDPIRAYAEREDANYAVIEMNRNVRITAAWRNVRVKNAEGKFADRDYCKEIAESKLSSAAWWWPAPPK